MNKLKITIIILLVLGLFAGADYYLNNLSSTQSNSNSSTTTTASKVVEPSLKINSSIGGYKVINQVQTNQIFEKIDLSNVANIKIYRNKLKKESIAKSNTNTNSSTTALPTLKKAGPKIPTIPQVNSNSTDSGKIIYLYEILGPKGQGNITYFNIKLQFSNQLNTETEKINETSSFGSNSFFFNNTNYTNTAFLLVQISDNIYGFQYNKQDSSAYDDVKAIINKLNK